MSGHHILIVDDYPEGAEIACMLLELLGNHCRIAHTGRDALAQAVQFQPDIVLLDLGLPDLDGYEVAREMRRFAVRQPYLVALTGRDERDLALESGFDEYLIKPAKEADLRAVLARAERDGGHAHA
jgi:DNA-binding response OmpR family regulator